MTSYWHRAFDKLIRYKLPELAEIDRPLPIYEATVAATGIDPTANIWKGITP